MNQPILIAMLAAVNIPTSVRLLRTGLPLGRRIALTVTVWLVPFLGAVIALCMLPGRSPDPSSGGVPRPPAPDRLPLKDGADFLVTENIFDGNGYPILDWEALEKWVAGCSTPAERAAALNEGRRAWLLHFRDVMTPHAHLVETRDALVLSSFDSSTAKAAAEYVGATRRRIERILQGLAEFPAGEKSVLLVLDSQDDYYRYVANYYPEDGEFSFSGGMFIDAGCPHFVGVLAELSILEPVIAHEMTHNSLAHLQLPLWLDEGIAVNSEHQLAPHYQAPRTAIEVLEKHLRFWTPELIQEFWSGKSFRRTDEGNQLSYDLARNIVTVFGRQWDSFVHFARTAERADGGAAAARSCLDLELGAMAAASIRVAPQSGWSPDPAAWKKVETKSG